MLIDVGGCPMATVPITASGDDEAIVRAMAFVDGHGVDLWDGVRFIDHFPARVRHAEGIDLTIQETV